MNTGVFKLRRLFALGATVLAATAVPAQAADWSDTEIQLLHGTRYHEPFVGSACVPGAVGNCADITKNIITLQNASGFKYGRNFFFVDTLFTTSAPAGTPENSAQELYGEFYTTWSLSKLTGNNISAGFIKDVNITGGINMGAKSNGAQPRVFLFGPTVDLDVPGFAFFNVDILAYVDRGRFNFGGSFGPVGSVANPANPKTTYQVTPSWKLPFTIGNTRWSFEGFMDIIGNRGSGTKSQILTQPQLRLDLGNFWGKKDTVFVGFEYQYWRNKFGLDGVNESHPQALLVWKF